MSLLPMFPSRKCPLFFLSHCSSFLSYFSFIFHLYAIFRYVSFHYFLSFFSLSLSLPLTQVFFFFPATFSSPFSCSPTLSHNLLPPSFLFLCIPPFNLSPADPPPPIFPPFTSVSNSPPLQSMLSLRPSLSPLHSSSFCLLFPHCCALWSVCVCVCVCVCWWEVIGIAIAVLVVV